MRTMRFLPVEILDSSRRHAPVHVSRRRPYHISKHADVPRPVEDGPFDPRDRLCAQVMLHKPVAGCIADCGKVEMSAPRLGPGEWRSAGAVRRRVLKGGDRDLHLRVKRARDVFVSAMATHKVIIAALNRTAPSESLSGLQRRVWCSAGSRPERAPACCTRP